MTDLRPGTDAAPSDSSLEEPATIEHRARGGWLAVAAAFVVGLVIGAAVLGFIAIDDDDSPVFDDPSTPEELRQVAMAKATAFFAAMNTGDHDAVVDIAGTSDPALATSFGFDAALARAGSTWTVHSCESFGVPGPTATVRCRVTLNDPVAVELGRADLDIGLIFDEDGSITHWDIQPTVTDFTYNAYLKAYHEAEYEAACSPTSYDAATIMVAGVGSAITPECGELWGSVTQDVVQWIRDGQPQP